MAFYSNFLEQCARKNVSASGAAVAIGLSNAAATGWKNGKVPYDATLAKLSDYFGCTVADLLRDENDEKPAPVRSELSKKEQLLNLIDGMSRAELIDTLKAVAARLEDEK